MSPINVVQSFYRDKELHRGLHHTYFVEPGKTLVASGLPRDPDVLEIVGLVVD